MTKICMKCGKEKDISEFGKNKTKNDGYDIYCKICANEKRKLSRQRNFLVQNENFKKLNGKKECTVCHKILPVAMFNKSTSSKDTLDNKCKNCQKDYDDSRKQQRQQYYKDNIDRFIKYREEHKEQSYEYQKQYRILNKERILERDRIRNKERWKNLNYRLGKIISNGINNTLRGIKSEQHWEDIVGYTVEQLKKHLEFQFTPEMNWDNFGFYWEIDHIIPRNLFNYITTNDEQFKICWSLANLRPLEKSLNRRRPKDGRDISKEQAISILGQKFYYDIMNVENKEEHM